MLLTCRRALLLAVVVMSAAVWVRSVGAASDPNDCEECKDLPYLNRLNGYVLSWKDDKEFDAFKFPQDKAALSVEGAYFRRTYGVKEGGKRASILQILRNYSTAIKKAGGQIFVEGACSDAAACGDWQGEEIISARLAQQGKEIYLLVHAFNDGASYDIYAVEKGEMRQDVSLALELAQSLEREGRVAVEIQFQPNTAAIKPESKSVLEQVATMLKEHPEWSLTIEGHTDSSGDPVKALKLSKDRAAGVAKALQELGIAGGRMQTAGFGAMRPIADNTTPEGRAKNRRVELVRQQVE